MLIILAHTAFEAAGFVALLSIGHSLQCWFRPWLQVLADSRAMQGNQS
ncbi:hypothetical protein [Novosphingobium sp.]